jgi:MFS family permease
MLYAFALVFGVADAFFFPAQTSIVPELVGPDQLQRANGIVQGTAQATVLVGPAIAGVVIATLGAGSSGASDGGVGIALLFDAATFLVSLVTLWFIKPRTHTAEAHPSILESIREGVRFVWRSPGLRAVTLVSLSANLFIVGPFEVGMPFIAYSRLPEGAAAFGIVMAAFGGGSLLGLIVASILPPPRPSRLGLTVIGTLALAGLGVAAVSAITSTLMATLVIGTAGMALGVGNLIGITWIQARVPQELMGRVMSLMITGSVGLVPISMLVAGAAVQVSLDGTMLVAGCGMALLCLVSLLSPSVRNLGLEAPMRPPAAGPATGDALSA